MQSKPSNNFTPELLAPAGSYNAAYYAFQAGADAVYFGLKEFSARKGAENFTLEEVAQLKGLAEEKGKRIYAALNILIREEELGKVADFLYDLESLGVDGVIIQDFGLLYLIRRWFPGLPIHASTQMAVHTPEGVAALKEYGVRRFILARELTWEELKKIRETHPDVELEVFIHGALCFSVSGSCLASGLLLGRSGNRGECAQICRSWFKMQEEADYIKDTQNNSGLFKDSFRQPPLDSRRQGHELKGNQGKDLRQQAAYCDSLPLAQPSLFGGEIEGYFFSCKDLETGEHILKLKALGIDAFKIEGRLKAPEWVAAVTSFYRALLDGEPSLPSPPSCHLSSRPFEVPLKFPTPPPSSLQKARRIFSRSTTPGYAFSSALPYADKSASVRSAINDALKDKETQEADTGNELESSDVTKAEPEEVGRSSAQRTQGRADFGTPSGVLEEVNPQGFPGMLDPQYPGHRGIWIGKVTAVKGNKFCLTTSAALGIRDGLQFLRPAQSASKKGIRLEAVPFRLDRMYTVDKKPILSCKAGDIVWIEGSTTEGTRHLPLTPPAVGTELFQISSHSDTFPQAPRKVRRKGIPLELHLHVQPQHQRFILQLLLPVGFLHPSVRSGPPLLAELTLSLPSEIARSSLSLEELSSKFLTPPADSLFILDRKVTKAEQAGGFISDGEIHFFIPPSRWKQLRRDLYEKALQELKERKNRYLQSLPLPSFPFSNTAQPTEPIYAQKRPAFLFLTDGDLEKILVKKQPPETVLPFHDNAFFLSLSPVVFQPDRYLPKVEQLILLIVETHPEATLYLGLNNVGHLPLARKLSKLPQLHFFADYGLYIANSFAWKGLKEDLLKEAFEKIVFFYPWIENPGSPSPYAAFPDGSFQPPLFIGRSCPFRSLPTYSRDDSEFRCQGSCASAYLLQGKRRFLLKSVRVGGTCLTLLFKNSL